MSGRDRAGLIMADSMFIHMLNRLGDVLLLSIIATVFCLPVVTIGATLSAVSYTAIRSIQGDDGYIWRKFWKSFKKNFKQSTIAWLIMAFIGFVLYVDIFFWHKMSQVNPGDIHKIMLMISCVLAVIYACIFVHVFALIGNYENTVKNSFSNASVLAIAQFPWTLLMLVILAVVFLVVRVHVLFIITFMFIGAGALAFIFGFIRIQVYKGAMKKAENAREELRREAEAAEAEDEESDADADEESNEDTEEGIDEDADEDAGEESDEESDEGAGEAEEDAGESEPDADDEESADAVNEKK